MDSARFLDLRALFPASVGLDPRPAETKAASAEARTTCDVALHYQTEHAYYVSRNEGPITFIDHDAVQGIIFAEAKTKQLGCT